MVAAVVAAVVVSGGPVAAQSGPAKIDAVRSGAATRVGPFYVTPSLMVENLGVDDNVFFDAETGDPQSDFLATITPQASLWLPVAHRALVSATVAPRLNYYRRLANARAIVPVVSGDVELFAGRASLFAGGSFSRGRERPNFEIDIRPLHTTTGADGGIRYALGPRTTVEAGAYLARTRYGRDEVFLGTPLRNTLDHDTFGVRLSAARRLTPKTAVDVTFETTESRFEVANERDATGFRAMAGVHFAATALIAGSARVGVRKLDPVSDGLPGFTGVASDVELTYRLLEGTLLTVRWSRDTSYSYDPLYPYFVRDGIGGRVRRQIVGRLDAIAGLDHGRSGYRTLAAADPLPGRIDRSRVYSIDLGWRLNRRTRAGVALAQEERTSSLLGGRDYTRRRIGMSFAYGM